MDKIIEQAAAQALLDRGAAFHIPAPFLLRVFGKKKIRIVIRRLYLGSLIHLYEMPGIDELKDLPVGKDAQGVISQMGAQAKSVDAKVILENIVPVTRAVAACILNRNWKIILFQKLVARHLRLTLDTDQLQELIMWLLVYSRAESFMNSIKFLSMMKVTSPMNLSPYGKGS